MEARRLGLERDDDVEQRTSRCVRQRDQTSSLQKGKRIVSETPARGRLREGGRDED